jgi:hypothetical protein
VARIFPGKRGLSVTVANARQLTKPLVSLSFADACGELAAVGEGFWKYSG